MLMLVPPHTLISKLDDKPKFNRESPPRDWFDWDRPAPGAKTEPDARPDGDRRALRNWLARNASKDNPTVIDRINFLGEQELQHEMEIAELVTIDLEHDNLATRITKDFYNHVSAQYAPDGRSIVYMSTPPGQYHPYRVRRTAICTMDADVTNSHTVLDSKEFSFFSPRYTLDAASLIVSRSP